MSSYLPLRRLATIGLLAGLVLSWFSSATPLIYAAPILTQPHLLVTDAQGTAIRRYDASTGAYIDELSSISPGGFGEMVLGSDHMLYVSSFGNSQVFRLNPFTGGSASVFSSVGLSGVRGIAFGPNGNLFAASPGNNKVIEFDKNTGAFVQDFVTNVATPIGITFGPDGNLYVARGHHEVSGGSSVNKYDGATGQFLGVFASANIDTPQYLTFGPNGDLYVSNQLNAPSLVRLNGLTGNLVQVLNPDPYYTNPQGLLFLPNGDLLLAAGSKNSVQRYDGVTGAVEGNFILDNSLLLSAGLVFVPEPNSFALLIVGAIGIASARFRKGRRKEHDARTL